MEPRPVYSPAGPAPLGLVDGGTSHVLDCPRSTVTKHQELRICWVSVRMQKRVCISAVTHEVQVMLVSRNPFFASLTCPNINVQKRVAKERGRI